MNDYAEQIRALAHETFGEIQRADEAVKAAEQRMRETPVMNGRGAEYAARAAAAKAKYAAAVDAQNKLRFQLPDSASSKLAAIRRQYAAELEQRYTMDPAQLDPAALELLKSGTMRPADYDAMLNKADDAGNFTMTRLIAKYAREAAAAAAEKNGPHDPKAQALRYIAQSGCGDPVEAALTGFDYVGDAFRRCVRNPSMIRYWDELTAPALERME